MEQVELGALAGAVNAFDDDEAAGELFGVHGVGLYSLGLAGWLGRSGGRVGQTAVLR